MELIFLVIIIAILISIFTGNPGYILVGVSGLLLLFAGLLTVVFLYCTICLLFSKKREAVFSRIDRPDEESKYKVAFYLVEGEEYPCLFPEEGIFRSKLYRKNSMCHVFVNYRMGKVFDRFAVTTCILGILCGVVLGFGIAAVYFL